MGIGEKNTPGLLVTQDLPPAALNGTEADLASRSCLVLQGVHVRGRETMFCTCRR